MSRKRQRSHAGGGFGDGHEAGDHAASPDCSQVRDTSPATTSSVLKRKTRDAISIKIHAGSQPF